MARGRGGRARGDTSPAAEGATLEAHQVRPASPVPGQSFGKGTLPSDQGQVWQEYDISVYTSKVQGTEHPEQAVIDWILRETGTEVWFTQPLGVLNANAKTVRVYHTPEMQRIVADVVGRFVNGTQDPHVLGLRVVAVDHPNWRAPFLNRLRPIPVQSAGIDAWLVSREDASVLLAELRRRIDFREHAATSLVFHNGQSQTVAQLRPRAYVRSFRARAQDNAWTGYDMERGQIQEGFTLQVSPLLSPDERTIDVVLKCGIDQVERLVPVGVDLPGFTGQMQRAEIQVPQLVSWRLHERFRWPTSHVLLLGCGVIASPGPDRPSALGLPNLLGAGGGVARRCCSWRVWARPARPLSVERAWPPGPVSLPRGPATDHSIASPRLGTRGSLEWAGPQHLCSSLRLVPGGGTGGNGVERSIRMSTTSRRVVITGLGLISPLGLTVDSFWDALVAGRSGVTALTSLPAAAFGISCGGEVREFTGAIDDFGPLDRERARSIRKGVKVMSREIQMGVAAAQRALADAGFRPGDFAPERAGVVFGSDYILSGPDEFVEAMAGCLDGRGQFDFGRWAEQGIPKITPLWLLKYLPNMPASHIAIYNDLRGPSNSLTVREASANLAIGEASRLIARGQADVIVAGATGTRVHPLRTLHAVMQEEVARDDGDPARVCRPFDLHRSGMVVAEGAGAVILESREWADRRGATIWGEVLGSGSSAVMDVRGVGDPRAAVSGALRQTLRQAGLDRESVGHVHAHGAATRRGDAEEAQAIAEVFAGARVPCP